jgi:hypothetical protein
VHRAVSALNKIDVEELSDADQERIADAQQALAELSVLE